MRKDLRVGIQPKLMEKRGRERTEGYNQRRTSLKKRNEGGRGGGGRRARRASGTKTR